MPEAIGERPSAVTGYRGQGLGVRTLATLGILGAVARLFNLGTYSLWLDEILLVGRASGSFAQVWQACQANAEHPPLSALVSALVLALTPSETALRLVHAAAGLAAALFFSQWAALALGRRAGLAAGLAFAISPFAVRYSQEIRPYAFLLLAAGWTLFLFEQGRRKRAGWGWTAHLAFVMALGLYSHYLYLVALVPIVWWLAESACFDDASGRAEARRLALRSAAAAAMATILFLPWLGTVGTAASRPAAGGSAEWTLDLLLRRLHFLMIGGKEGESMTLGGAFCVTLVALGCFASVRSRAGRAVLAGAVVGTVGVEAGLLAREHWSNARYDIVGWVFLVALLGLGCELLSRGRVAVFATTATLIAASCFAGLLRYDRTGRPEWDRVAAAVSELRRDKEPLLTENEWTRLSLEHYLKTGGPGEPPVTVGLAPGEAVGRWTEGRCALLVTSGYPEVPSLRALAAARPLLAGFPASEARIVLLGPRDRQILGPIVEGKTAVDEGGDPCPDALRRLPLRLRMPRQGRVDRIRRWINGPVRVLEFDRASAPHLGDRWSTFEEAEGRTFVWAKGRESAVYLDLGPPADREVEIRFWPYGAEAFPQELTLVVNATPVASLRLDGGWQELVIPVPAAHWREGENTLRFRFLRTVAPRDVDPASSDARPLTAAFDRLELRDVR